MHVKQAEVKCLEVDGREWGNLDLFGAGDLETDESEDEVPDGENEAERSASSSKANTSQGPPSSGRPPTTGKRLRPAIDVFNRIRWDPNLDRDDFVIGYDDRFVGVQEMRLDSWKTENTDEEFIPQHRILYFRRMSDGIKVWDRESRADEIFGSGAGSV
jgi:uncharacterized protein (UPF0248 family)